MIEQPRKSNAKRFLRSFLIIVIIIGIIYSIQLPFYVQMPGKAVDLKPMVHVQEVEKNVKGTFMLTYVSSITHTNFFSYLYALLTPNTELVAKKDVLRGQTVAEYSQRQEYVMLTSQSSALQAAYEKAGIPYEITSGGVIVLELTKGMPAEKVLMPGDRIIQIDDVVITTSEDLQQAVAGKGEGDAVVIRFARKGVEKQETVVVAAFPPSVDQAAAPRYGIGVAPADVLSIETERADQQVSIQAGDIGGPSAGLMFALEIYNRLTPDEDITKGYQIAGTGTINAQGTVCPIGGVEHKIVAAHREKADIFFVPRDKVPPACNLSYPVTNSSDAAQKASQIKTTMNVVPVDTLEEAIAYLATLPSK